MSLDGDRFSRAAPADVRHRKNQIRQVRCLPEIRTSPGSFAALMHKEGAENMDAFPQATSVMPNARPSILDKTSVSERAQELHRIASELYRQQADWVTFFRRILGVEGVVRQMFPTTAEMNAWEQCEQYAEVQQMLAKLRERGGANLDDSEPTRVITVRLPKSLHESLRTEAHEKRTSMNKLCISKLLQMIDDELIPTD
jgi:predicted HicB family RNase H-like nuclease